MAIYKVSLEIGEDGWYMAHVPELAGCSVKASSRAKALKALPAEIADYLSWLREIGEEAPPQSEPIELEVTETFRIPRKVAEGDTHAAFAHDLKPLTKRDLGKYLKLLQRSRQRLVQSLEQMEAEFGNQLEEFFYWRPDEASSSIGEVLGHILRAEAWYLARLAKKIGRWDHYVVARQLTLDRLKRLSTKERKQKATHPPGDEIWTARKVIRRALWHERYHIRQIEELIHRFRRRKQSES